MSEHEHADEHDWLAERFEAERSHLRAVAYRMLGRLDEADDAVQEAWLRLSHSDASGIENLGGWLTTVVGRVCLDMLRTRQARREESLEARESEPPVMSREEGINPEQETLLADAVGLALLVVLDTLDPAERLAFVLHDLFDVPFDEIASIVNRSPAAARQLASRARRRVRGATPVADADADLARQREVVDAFLAASRNGDFDGLLAVLDPDVVVRADRAAVALGAPLEVRGMAAVARQFFGHARGAQPALVDGAAGLVWAPDGQPRVVFRFTISGGRIVLVELVAEPEDVRQLDVEILGG